MDTEKNKIISEFITGRNASKRRGLIGLWIYVHNCYYPIDELKYDTSWDWLIPCCKKCDEVWESHQDPELRRLALRIAMSAGAYNIQATYEAVIQFIQHYNDKHKTK